MTRACWEDKPCRGWISQKWPLPGSTPAGDQGGEKGLHRDEVDQVTAWLTGYTPEELAGLAQSDTSYGDFFRNAPAMNPDRSLITGKICGIRVEEIEDPLMRDIRYLDKLVDELAKGKPMEKILRNIVVACQATHWNQNPPILCL